MPPHKALDYVAAYTCGNDISSRRLQRDPKLVRGVPQWGFSKGFDTYAPLGPCHVRAGLIGDPAELTLRAIIDGEVRQQEQVSDLFFDCVFGFILVYRDNLEKGFGYHDWYPWR